MARSQRNRARQAAKDDAPQFALAVKESLDKYFNEDADPEDTLEGIANLYADLAESNETFPAPDWPETDDDEDEDEDDDAEGGDILA